jgi:D-alanyl-D-alanine carboxypeptidase (penicillin-binding protein 5/6)
VSRLVRTRAIAAGCILAAIGVQAALVAGVATGAAGPPPTPVPPRGSLSPFPSTLATPADPVAAPSIDARAALLADLDTGQVLQALHPTDRRPIASITKIMTALLILERTDPDDVVTVDPRAVFQRHAYGADSTLGLRAGERLRVRDLLYGMLLGSANDAAAALAIAEAGSQTAFVAQMNTRAKALGMRHTRFFSVHGLDDRGHSTAADLLRLVRAADRTPGFDGITATKVHAIPAPRGPTRRIQNRNALLWLYAGAFGTKTGTTAGAGACLVASAARDGRRLVAIVLGAPREAFSDAAALLNHGFEGFTSRTIVSAGDDVGTVGIRGGTVTVAAGTNVRALVPVGAGDVTARALADPTVAFPPVNGQRVGTVTFSVPGSPLGTAPLVVSGVPPPPPLGGAWWIRAPRAIGRAVVGAIAALAGS